MNRFVHSSPIAGLPYIRTEYTLLDLSVGRSDFVQASAAFFVQNWMSSALPRMLDAWKNWDRCSEEDKTDYRSYLDVALFSNGHVRDDPSDGYTSPMATFAETMLRWLRRNFAPTPLLMEPIAPQPPGDGKIDLVEITGFPKDYASMKVTLWEVKSSDGQAAESHNSKIYKQLDDYPRRFFPIANCMAENYAGEDIALKRFLRDMARLVRNRCAQTQYGVLVAYDPRIAQRSPLVPALHQHPPGYHLSSRSECHTLAILLIPDFRCLRLDVWRSLHLI